MKEVPKCPKHNEDLDMIYPEDDFRLCTFLCGCIITKRKNLIEGKNIYRKNH